MHLGFDSLVIYSMKNFYGKKLLLSCLSMNMSNFSTIP